MDDKQDKTETKEKVTNQAQIANSGNGFFTIFGKISAVLFILVIIFSLGFALGKFSDFKISLSSLMTPEKTVKKESPPASYPTAILRASPSTAVKFISPTLTPVFSGQYLDFKIGSSTNSLKVPEKWILTQKKEDFSSIVTVENSGFSLIIRGNEATEGAPCGFPDAPLKPTEMYPSVSEYTYESYAEFKGETGGIYRRVDITANPSAGKNFFTICQKRGTDWMTPTNFGFVMYEVPYTDNPETKYSEQLKILDGMFSTIKIKS
jgi:hypothetical protein